MSRSSPAPPPHPERRTDEREPLVDALGGYVTPLHDDAGRPAVDEPSRARATRSDPTLRLASIAAIATLVLVVLLVLIL